VEKWSEGVLMISRRPRCFLDDQAVNPVAIHLLAFETFDKSQEAIFELECKRVQKCRNPSRSTAQLSR